MTVINQELNKYFPANVSQIINEYAAPTTSASTTSASTTSATVLVSKATFILYQLLPGKPDPQEQCSFATLNSDKRRRVRQAPYKENTCWYYSLNMIRNRIGKNPTQE